ncbi:MAG: DUF2867 domain-containing protein [Polaribacter sp.]|nr:DUF2867 domain-containing protein [Polaribacter sp.]
MKRKTALIIMFFILGTVLVFHFLILTEQIPYDKVWAGKLNSVEEMKTFETFSILLNTFMLAVLYIKHRQLAQGIKNKVIDMLIWSFSFFFLLNTAGNLFSKNIIELILGTLLTLTSAILCIVIVKKKMKRKVIEERIRLTDDQKDLLTKIDFVDIFATTNHTNNLEEITNLVFNTTPKWVNSLFVLRNRIAGLFGLKTEVPNNNNQNFKVGGYIKFFKIYSISDTEIILGADDLHLNFRVLINDDKSDSYNIKIITLVEYNNLKGKIYMSIIKPFHRQIVKRMIKNAHKEKLN